MEAHRPCFKYQQKEEEEEEGGKKRKKKGSLFKKEKEKRRSLSLGLGHVFVCVTVKAHGLLFLSLHCGAATFTKASCWLYIPAVSTAQCQAVPEGNSSSQDRLLTVPIRVL